MPGSLSSDEYEDLSSKRNIWAINCKIHNQGMKHAIIPRHEKMVISL